MRNTILNKVKVTEYLNPFIVSVRTQKKVYKYLTIDSAIKMLQHNNIQFTRADKLNDELDCHISKVKFDNILPYLEQMPLNATELIDKIKNKHGQSLNNFGICSLGTSFDNSILWNCYTKSKGIFNGVCIELNLNATINCLVKEGIKVIAFFVDYIDNPINSIPYELYLGTDVEKAKFIKQILATKTALLWSEEKELRIILPIDLSDEYYRVKLFKSCFGNIYVGNDIEDQDYKTILEIVKSNYPKMEIIKYQ